MGPTDLGKVGLPLSDLVAAAALPLLLCFWPI